MKAILLYNEDKTRIMGSDGFMRVDGRFNTESVKQAVRDRNKLFETPPDKPAKYSVAKYFAYWQIHRSDKYSDSSIGKLIPI